MMSYHFLEPYWFILPALFPSYYGKCGKSTLIQLLETLNWKSCKNETTGPSLVIKEVINADRFGVAFDLFCLFVFKPHHARVFRI